MRLRCIHGYFIFEETKYGQISDYMGYTGFKLVSRGKYYTFEKLAAAPDYSLAGKTLVSIPAIATFEGEPWEVFEANGFVYDFNKDLVVPIATVVDITRIEEAGNRFISPGLIMPGSINKKTKARVKSFDGWWSRDRLNWLYSEVEYV